MREEEASLYREVAIYLFNLHKEVGKNERGEDVVDQMVAKLRLGIPL